MTREELEAGATAARDDALRRRRQRFAHTYGNFWKCAACGAYLDSIRVDINNPPRCCHECEAANPIATGYAPPPPRLVVDARVPTGEVWAIDERKPSQ